MNLKFFNSYLNFLNSFLIFLTAIPKIIVKDYNQRLYLFVIYYLFKFNFKLVSFVTSPLRVK